MIVIDSIDGAEHHRSKKSITSVISFSTSLTNPDWINDMSGTAGSSHNILTLQQLRGKETYESMIPSTIDYFNSKNYFKQRQNETSQSTYYYYDMHDCKMLYLLCQHSLWNRKHKPFLLCNCKRGEGVINNNTHQCVERSHQNEIDLYDRSLKRWERKRARLNEGECYNYKQHTDCVDEFNEGVSHFGVHPELLPRNEIRFDTFHLKCSITKKLMSWLRNFLLNSSTSARTNFSIHILSKFWNQYHLFVWRTNKAFSSFQGNELALFIANISSIKNYLVQNFVQDNDINNFVLALNLWESMFKFLGITHISKEQEQSGWYPNQIQSFKNDCIKFYDCGKTTFLSTNETRIGSNETCYAHVLRFYMPRIAETTYLRHKVGVGVFNMQGFERRNKESKNVYKRFSNNKKNVMASLLGRLYDAFETDKNPY